MSAQEILKHLEERVNSLQRKITELAEQREEIERQIKKYRELMQYYRGVYEAEAGVGIQGAVMPVIESLEPSAESKLDELLEGIKGHRKTLTWAITQILTDSKPLRIEKICEAVAQRYPDIAKRPKNLLHAIEVSCLRLSRDGVLERAAPRCYGIAQKEEDVSP